MLLIKYEGVFIRGICEVATQNYKIDKMWRVPRASHD